MSENVQNTPETPKSNNDIDLGELFRMIGRAFNRLFAFLRNVFLFLLDLVIRALIMIREHIVKFVIVGFLSLVVGWFIDSRQEKVYGASMYVKTNYGSVRQLYSNIKYYQGLAEDADSTTLAEIFGINKDQAGSLRGFFIEPDVTENGLLFEYNDFMKKADTTFVQDEIDFKKFKNSKSPLDFDTHQISVFSVEKSIIPKLQDPIVTKNIENYHIKKQKEIVLKNLDKTEKALEKRLIEIDTLNRVYKELLRKEPNELSTKGAGTYIQMASNNDNKTKELELLNLNEVITNKILEISLQRDLSNETINVLSDFSPGAEVKTFYDRFLFKIPVITFILLVIFILLRELNSYLNRYTGNKKLNV